MLFEKFGKIPRLSRECVITEKIDGTNGQICIERADAVWLEGDDIPFIKVTYDNINYNMFIGSRNRWLGYHKDNHGFWKWCEENKNELIKLGEGRHFGEWWGKDIQRGYGLEEKRFSLFNVHKWNDPEIRPKCCHVVPIITILPVLDSIRIDESLSILNIYGSYAAPGFMKPEGIIIYHTAKGGYFKKTIENDEKPKGI